MLIDVFRANQMKLTASQMSVNNLMSLNNYKKFQKPYCCDCVYVKSNKGTSVPNTR